MGRGRNGERGGSEGGRKGAREGGGTESDREMLVG